MTNSDQLVLDKKNIDTILVLDFGSQYTQLIARRIRELDVFSIILPWDISKERILEINPTGIILSGGPESVTNKNTPRIPEIIFDLDIPILGICYGMQTLAEQFGGQVTASSTKEFGHASITLEQASILFDGFDLPKSKIKVKIINIDKNKILILKIFLKFLIKKIIKIMNINIKKKAVLPPAI